MNKVYYSQTSVDASSAFNSTRGEALNYEAEMGFTKLDENILLSSIMSEDANTFKVWIALLASCKSNGISPATIPYLSSVCRIDIDIVEKSILKLSAPDKYSRSLENEGRRIERVDGGFKIINYQKYREHTYSDSPEAIKKRKQRGHKGDMSPNQGDTLSSASSSYSSSFKYEDIKETRNIIPPKIELITEYCNERKNNVTPQKFFDFYESKGWIVGKNRMKDWQAAVRTWEQSNTQAAPAKPKTTSNWSY